MSIRYCITTWLILIIIVPAASLAGIVSGSLVDEQGEPILESLRVGYSQDYEEWTYEVTEEGEFSFDLPQSYYIFMVEGHGDESWHYRACYPGALSVYEAEWVFVPEIGEVDGIDIETGLGGRFRGSASPAEGGEFDEFSITARLFEKENFWLVYVGSDIVGDPSNYVSPIILCILT